jgi:hypothetical protein
MDRILRDEGDADVFAARRWFPDSDEESTDSGPDVSEDGMS